MPEPEIVVEDASQTQAELNAKIDAELGLPHKEIVDADKTTEEDGATDKSGEGADVDDDQRSEDKPDDAEDIEDVEEPEDVEEEPVKPTEPSNVDSFIEVEDAEGVTHKISRLEDLPEDFQYKTARQPLEILRKLDKLESDAKAAAEVQRVQAEEAEFNKTKQEQFNAWDKEVNEQAKLKRIDIKDTERIDAVFKHMNDINAARIKAKNPNLITSFEDALDKFEVAEGKTKEAEAQKADNDKAKEKARILGSTSAAAGTTGKPYVAGSYRSIDDVPL